MSVIIEDIVPEEYRMIKHTNYTEVNKYIHCYILSKRNTRDIENIRAFVPNHQKNGCARLDAVYSTSATTKSHIKVMERDEYWAEQHRKFPHLVALQGSGSKI